MSRSHSSDLFSDPQAFRQQLRIAAVQVEGLSPSELSTALAYEIEPFSHIPPAEAETAFRAVPDPDTSVKVYEVAVRRRGRRGGASSGGGKRLLRLVVAITILGIAGDAGWIAWQRRDLSATVARQQSLDSRIRTVERQTREAKAARESLMAARKAAENAQGAVASVRADYPALLSEIAEACRHRAVLASLESEGGKLSFSARSLSPRAATEVREILAGRIRKYGFSLSLGTLVRNGETTTFECEVTHD